MIHTMFLRCAYTNILFIYRVCTVYQPYIYRICNVIYKEMKRERQGELEILN